MRVLVKSHLFARSTQKKLKIASPTFWYHLRFSIYKSAILAIFLDAALSAVFAFEMNVLSVLSYVLKRESFESKEFIFPKASDDAVEA